MSNRVSTLTLLVLLCAACVPQHSGCPDGSTCDEDSGPVDSKGTKAGTGGKSGRTKGSGGTGGHVGLSDAGDAGDAGDADSGGSMNDASLDADGSVDLPPDVAIDAGASCNDDTDCSGDTPRCDPLTHACVQCISDILGDCSGAAPRCDEATFRCVECLDDGHVDCAGAEPLCNPATNACAECLADADCTSKGKVCDEATNTCVACTANVECTNGYRPQCTDNTCVKCTDDEGCVGHPDKGLCRTSDGSCQGCLTDADCANPTPDCQSGECRGCSSSEACTGRMDGPTPIAACNTVYGTPLYRQCVTCTAANETACGDYSCERATNTCSSTLKESVQTCGVCQADNECASGSYCMVEESGRNAVLVGHCFKSDPVQADCKTGVSPAIRPYTLRRTITSVDGVLKSVCTPPSGCRALADASALGAGGGKICAVAADCGGYCPPNSDPYAPLQCTYWCNVDNDCPVAGFKVCSSSSGQCRPPP